MATHKSDIITSLDSQSIIDKQVDGDRTNGLLLLAAVEYVLVGTEEAEDVVELFDLPAGATVVPEMSQVALANPGTLLVIKIGDAYDDDRYAHTVSLNQGGIIPFHAGADNIPVGITTPVRTTERTRVVATVATATGLNANVKVRFTIAYRIRG